MWLAAWVILGVLILIADADADADSAACRAGTSRVRSEHEGV